MGAVSEIAVVLMVDSFKQNNFEPQNPTTIPYKFHWGHLIVLTATVEYLLSSYSRITVIFWLWTGKLQALILNTSPAEKQRRSSKYAFHVTLFAFGSV